MAYLRAYQAAAQQGDPGILRTIGRVGGAFLRSTPIGGIVGGLLGGQRQTPAMPPMPAQFKAGPPGARVVGRVSPRGTVGVCPAGQRPLKRGGCTSRKRPRMNPGNTRALRRSMRRVQAFAQLARQTISFTRRTKMKKRRRG